MSLDRRAARAAEALAPHLDGTSASVADLEVRQGRRQQRRLRTALVGFAVVLLVLVPVLVLARDRDDSAPVGPAPQSVPFGTLASGAWSSVPVHTSGLGDDSFVSAVASTADGIVAVGSRPVDGADVRAAWSSEDGFTWVAADTPAVPGSLTAVGADGDTLLAVGTAGSGAGPADAVWRSDDGGRKWTVVAEGTDLFGEPAPSGRPFVTGILRSGPRWVAVGGAADGSGETWVSEDGREWTATFPEDRTGGPSLVPRSDGSLLAYWGVQAWTSADGVTWAERPPALPAGVSLMAVADGAEVGVGYLAADPYTTPTPLLRSADGGLTWTEDPSFLAADPDATAWVADVVGGVAVVGGSDNGSAQPMAWASTGGDSWLGLPASLSEGQRSGGMRLIASVGSNVVMMAGGPVASSPGQAPPPAPARFFVLDTAQLPPPPTPVVLDPALVSRPGESAKDLAERIVREVFGEEMVTSKVQDTGASRLVTLESAAGVSSVATISAEKDGTYAFVDLVTDGLALRSSGDGAVAGSGILTVSGLDGSLGSPEVMVDAAVAAGPVGPFALVESSWLMVELRLSDGRVLRQLSPR